MPGESHKFMLPINGVEEECFVVNFRGEFHAYVNRCRHIPIAMDWVDNHFFAEGGRYLMCQTHGALFAPATGECLAGPADTCGKFLFRVPLEVEHGLIYARPPGRSDRTWSVKQKSISRLDEAATERCCSGQLPRD